MTSSINALSLPNDSPPNIVEQAIDWHMRQQDDQLSPSEQAQFEDWLNQNGEHRQTYARIQNLWQKFDDVEPEVIRPMLGNTPDFLNTSDFLNVKKPRKKSLKKAATALSILFVGFMVYQQQKPQQLWVANYQTNIGEQRTVQLPDNSTLILNTQTVVELDFTNKQRHIVLKQGELFIQVAKDQNRPLIVSTQNATARALGTQLMVQIPGEKSQSQAQAQTKVAVTESQVEACTSRQWYQLKPSNCVILSAGDATNIRQQTIEPKQQADVAQITGWVTGKLAFDDQPLSTVIAELQRYSQFELQVSPTAPDLNNLRVSGVFPTQDTARSLELLASRLPIQVKQTEQKFIISAR